MIARALWTLGSVLAAVLLITLAVSNRHGVQLVLDPFTPEAPVISTVMPFYVYLFAMLILGVILGGLATWVNQGRWRRLVRIRTHEGLRWKGEAERLMRERDAGVAAAGERRKQLTVVGR